MSSKTHEQKWARKLQAATGWAYMYCLALQKDKVSAEELSTICATKGLDIAVDFLIENRCCRPPGRVDK